jgi:hypothetical protein
MNIIASWKYLSSELIGLQANNLQAIYKKNKVAPF